jgi:hypothetical protein
LHTLLEESLIPAVHETLAYESPRLDTRLFAPVFGALNGQAADRDPDR